MHHVDLLESVSFLIWWRLASSPFPNWAKLSLNMAWAHCTLFVYWKHKINIFIQLLVRQQTGVYKACNRHTCTHMHAHKQHTKAILYFIFLDIWQTHMEVKWQTKWQSIHFKQLVQADKEHFNLFVFVGPLPPWTSFFNLALGHIQY